MTDPKAVATCENILSLLRKSGLNFVSQKTPFSAYLTIRKKFFKNFQNLATTFGSDMDENDEKLKKSENENLNLKNELEENLQQIEKLKSENDVLQKKIANAEKEVLKNVENAKETESKLKLEISYLKLGKKEINNKMLELKKELSAEEKKVKVLEKTISRLEAKNNNLKKQIANCKADKNNNKNENEKLGKELEILQRKISNAKELKTSSIQTEPFDTAQNITECSENVSCLVCSNVLESYEELKNHSRIEHSIIIDVEKLRYSDEEDAFTKMVKSVEVDSQYLMERAQYYPQHWDHIPERIKIRMLLQMKYKTISKEIDKNLAKNYNLKTRCNLLSFEV